MTFLNFSKKIANNLIVIFCLALITMQVKAQISTISTTTGFTNNNGSGAITFNLVNTNSYPIIIKEFRGVTGTSGTVATEVYFNNNPVNGAPGAISALNGWTLVASGSFTGVANTTTTAVQTFLSGLNLTVAALDTIGVTVFAAGQRYHGTGTTLGPTTITTGGVSLITGPNIGYAGGTPPAAPGNSPRGWIGEIDFIPAIKPYNNASVTELVTPKNFCAGTHNVSVRVANKGSNVINSVNLNWQLDGITQTQLNLFPNLDTIGGAGISDTVISLGSVLFANGVNRTVKAWTSLPNFMNDTVNIDDTIFVNLKPSLSGTITVGGTNPNYTTLSALVADLNNFGICGPVTVNIAPNSGPFTGPLNFTNISGSSNINTITINGNGNTVTSTVTPLIQFTASKFITIDSLNIIGATGFAGFGIHIGTQSRNITINKCTVNVGTTSTSTLNAGIVVSGSAAAATAVGNNAQYLTITNNTVIGGYYGITLIGNASYLDNFGHNLSNNLVQDFYLYGIFTTNADTVSIINNNINRAGRSALSTFYGIYVSSGRNLQISRNRIHTAGTGTYAAYPIYITTSVNSIGYETIFANNLIYNINTTGTFYGVYALGTLDRINFYHNTINHNVPNSTGVIRGVWFSAIPNNVNFRNNAITISGSGSGIKTNIYVTTTSLSFLSNNNILFNNATAGTNLIGYWTANSATLADWSTASGQDLNSVSFDPLYVNPSLGNFTTMAPTVDNIGVSVGVTTDINGALRSLNFPDAGAFENPPAVQCSGTPFSGNATSNATVVAANQNFNLSLINDSLAGGLKYLWFTSTTGLPGSYTVMPNDTFRTVTKSQTVTRWYRCVVSCLSSNDTSTAVMVTVPLPLIGNYTLNSAMPASSTNFQSFTNFALALNLGGVSGQITLTVVPNSGPYLENVSFGNINGISQVNNVLIIGNGNTVSSSISPLMSFSGSKYITIDSLNIIGATGYAGFGVHIGSQSQYLTIRKCTVDVGTTSTSTLNAGIVVSGSTTSAVTAGNNAQYLTITDNTIIGGYYGLTLFGNASYLDNYGHNISKNKVQDFYLYGIYVANSDTTTIADNDINRATRGTLSTLYGIFSTTSRNLSIRRNKIHATGTGTYTAYPMYLSTSVNSAGYESLISNNLIYDINTTGTFYGIYALGTLDRLNFYHNTIHHNITGSTGTIRGVWCSVAPNNVNFRNNIISLRGSGTGVKTNIYITTTSTTVYSNNNVFFNDATGGTNVIGYFTANQTTLADWQLTTGLDSNSVSFNPVFSNPAANLMNPLSINVDNIGAPVGILTDVEGNLRSTSTPDAGAYEFTGLAADMSLIDASLKRSSICYNTNDTAFFTIKNLFGAPVNFATDPLTINYNVSGPVNSLGSITINTGTLAIGETRTVFVNNISTLQPGNYTLSAYISSNLVNTSTTNDTLTDFYNELVKPIISVTPKQSIVTQPTDTVVLKAESPLFASGEVKFTEICHWRLATGAAPAGGWPSYMLADDYVELTGVPSSDLAGYTMEEWTGTTLQHTVTFPANTLFSANGTMIIATGQLGASVPSPTNFYYHSGNTVTHSSTGDLRGYVIKNASGTIVDATTYGAYTFPTASGVTSADWSGSTPAVSSAGNRLIGPDNNSGSNWITENASDRQDPNIKNANVPTPAPSSMTGFNWTYLGNSIDTNASITVGPYTVPGVYAYVAVYTTVCGTFYDTAYVTATSTVPVKMLSFRAEPNKNDVMLNWATASEENNSHFNVEVANNKIDFVTIGKVNGNGNSVVTNKYQFNHFNAFGNNNSILYYRLAQIDFNGNVNYSNIVNATNQLKQNDIALYPNPSNGNITIDFGSKGNQNAAIEVYDNVGKLVFQNKVNLLQGNQSLNLNLPLSNGVYFIVINHNQNNTTQKLIISK